MKSEKVLLPLDIARCPLEAIAAVNELARSSATKVSLLHVVRLNIVSPVNSLYEEISQEVRWHLNRVAERYLDPALDVSICVRKGEPWQEIVAQAQRERVSLIVLPTFGASFRARLRALWSSELTPPLSALHNRVIQNAPCPVFLVRARNTFACEELWGRPSQMELAEELDWGVSFEPAAA
jgi:nucleotide-binding universal stress UspA family protein